MNSNRYTIIDKEGKTVMVTWNIDTAKDIALEVSLFEGSATLMCGEALCGDCHVIEYVDGVVVYEGA